MQHLLPVISFAECVLRTVNINVLPSATNATERTGMNERIVLEVERLASQRISKNDLLNLVDFVQTIVHEELMNEMNTSSYPSILEVYDEIGSASGEDE